MVNFIFTLYSYWWLFLTIITFWKIWFPANAKSSQAKGCNTYFHIAVVVLSLTLSMIPIGASLATGGYAINTFSSSLNVCYPRNSAAFFYSFVVPFCIILPTGSTFNLLTFWKVLRVKKHLIKQVIMYTAKTDGLYEPNMGYLSYTAACPMRVSVM